MGEVSLPRKRKGHGFRDMTGQVIGKVTVLHEVTSFNGARWKCRCSCGVEFVKHGTTLRAAAKEPNRQHHYACSRACSKAAP